MDSRKTKENARANAIITRHFSFFFSKYTGIEIFAYITLYFSKSAHLSRAKEPFRHESVSSNVPKSNSRKILLMASRKPVVVRWTIHNSQKIFREFH